IDDVLAGLCVHLAEIPGVLVHDPIVAHEEELARLDDGEVPPAPLPGRRQVRKGERSRVRHGAAHRDEVLRHRMREDHRITEVAGAHASAVSRDLAVDDLDAIAAYAEDATDDVTTWLGRRGAARKLAHPRDALSLHEHLVVRREGGKR